jgi:NADH-quinone oxidoreductase subunit D
VSYDVRKASPYLVYDRFNFEVPVGERGDNYDRFNMRFQEIGESKKILEQAMKQLPAGPVMVGDPKVALPPKERVYNSIEGLMNHFKLIMEGIKVPAGETYTAVEGANGELGFYVVSDGSGRPYRVRVRPPCFLAMGALNKMLIGRMIPDIITTFGMINMIGGECDR